MTLRFRRGCGLVATVLLAAALGGLARAQNAAPAAATPSPAPTVEVSPARVDLAKKILISVGLKASMDQIVPSMLSQLQDQLLQMHPEMGKALHETLVTLEPEFQQGEDGVFTDTAHTLASQLSEDELKQTLAFCDSVAGKKYTQAQAPVLEELAASGGIWREKLTKVMVDRLREEMKKKGFSF
jgi:hypothetical protein